MPAAPPDPVVHPPHANGSRRAALAGAVHDFLAILSTNNSAQSIALATWGSEITLDTFERALTGGTFPAASLDVGLGTNFAAVSSAMADRGHDVMLGGTNLSAGIDLGVEVLTGPNTKAFATKTMIVVTDGQWNQGRAPSEAALEAKQAGITIHTVTFLDGANQQDMIDAASPFLASTTITRTCTLTREQYAIGTP
jgi:Ca-activated chloride channel family protein